MKANELNTKDLIVEDWVEVISNDHLKYVQIAEIYQNSILTKESEFESEEISIDNIKPIPLTPEILEKNGFKGEAYAILKLDEHSWLEYYYHEHRLRKYWSGIDEWQNHSEVKDLTFQCHCYYVHELQHALKLCGIEKTIEL